jgi:hypothetical protein
MLPVFGLALIFEIAALYYILRVTFHTKYFFRLEPIYIISAITWIFICPMFAAVRAAYRLQKAVSNISN